MPYPRPRSTFAAPLLALATLALPPAGLDAQEAPAPSADEAAVRAALEHYLAGHATGLGEHFRAAFHDVTDLYWVADGELRTRTVEDYIAGAPGRPAADEGDRRRRIAWIEVAGDAAVARVELAYPGAFIVDYMSLLRANGEWRIVNKIFHVDRSGATADPAAEIAAASRSFSRAYVEGDTATIRDLYTADGLLLPHGREVRGRDGIGRYFGPRQNGRTVAHAMTSDELKLSGDRAIDVGTWHHTWQPAGGEPRDASGRYLVVWRREGDGRWRIEYDMWHPPAGG